MGSRLRVTRAAVMSAVLWEVDRSRWCMRGFRKCCHWGPCRFQSDRRILRVARCGSVADCQAVSKVCSQQARAWVVRCR